MLRLEELRRRNGWSQAELARRARLHPSDVSRIETLRLRPYTAQLTKLSRALGIPAQDAGSLMEEATIAKR